MSERVLDPRHKGADLGVHVVVASVRVDRLGCRRRVCARVLLVDVRVCVCVRPRRLLAVSVLLFLGWLWSREHGRRELVHDKPSAD
jgi:hypothetical protein